MPQSLEDLLFTLGYEGSPCFLRRGDGRFETELGCGHIFRRAEDSLNPKSPRWRAEGVYGIRESTDDLGRFTPIVYVCTAIDEEAASELHRLLWNQDVAPYVIVHSAKGTSVYSGFRYDGSAKTSEGRGIIAALEDYNDAESIVRLFHRREIDEGRLWHHPRLRVETSHRVYHRLLSSLRELDRKLQSDGLSADVSHALIGKYVYLQYLRDRGILSDERLAKWGLEESEVFGRNAKKASLGVLTDQLDAWLNGEVFPLPLKGKNAPTIAQVQAVAGAFQGDETVGDDTQLHLDFKAYNFSYIPIETLSLVYEQFLQSSAIATPGEKPKKTKAREEGAYYTPLPLVNFMLAELERRRPLVKGMKVFDPSSGSGAFLVQAYRLLVEKTYPETKRRPKPRELRELLESSIFGCDVDGDACQVTQLSLLLTLLDYVTPPDLTGPMHSFKLPTLCETTDEKKLLAGHTPNILKGNFFGIKSALGEAVTGKRGGKVDWSREGFDWVVGNPPWKTISPKKLGENDGPVWDWMKANAKSKPVGLNQAAQAFSWEAPQYLKSEGECMLLVPANGLFEKPSTEYRKLFFRKNYVQMVANFSNFARVLFDGRAEVPAAAVCYRRRSEEEGIDGSETIHVYSPFVVNQEATCPSEAGKRGKIWSLSVNAGEISVLEQREVATGSGLPWKISMWGSSWDERLLKRLEAKWPMLESLEGSTLIARQGPELRSEAGDLVYEDNPELEEQLDLLGKPTLDIPRLARYRNLFVFPDTAIPKNQKAYLRLRGGKSGLAVCKPPHVIVSAARTFAVYSDEFIVVPARQIGIVSCSQDRDFLKALSLFLSSDFAFYHQFFRSTQMGIKYEVATFAALRKMPIPLLDLSQEKLSEWVELHGKLAKCKPRKLDAGGVRKSKGQTEMFDSVDTGLDDLLEKLNDLTADALGLTKAERSLIHDLVQVRYALNDGKRGDAAMRAPEKKELRQYARALKEELDGFVGDEAGRRHKVTVLADGKSAMVEIDFTIDRDEARTPILLSATGEDAEAFRKTRDLLLEDSGSSQWAYFNRNLRIYRGRKVYVFKPLNRFHLTQSSALTDAGQIIAETLSGGHV